MQRFQFRLDRVLAWRRKKCRMEENRLSACLGLVNSAEQKLVELRSERAAIDREMLARSPIPAPDFLNLGLYRLRSTKEEAELSEERRQRVQAATQQRVRVQQAQQRVKLLEKMRQRRLEEYTTLASHEEEQAASEAYLSRWTQSRRAEKLRGCPSGMSPAAVKDLTTGSGQSKPQHLGLAVTG